MYTSRIASTLVALSSLLAGCGGLRPPDVGEQNDALCGPSCVVSLPPPAIAPDLMVELNFCLTAAQRANLIASLNATAADLANPTTNPTLSTFFAGALGDSQCIGTSERAGIWHTATPDVERYNGLLDTDILNGQQFAIRIDGPFLSSALATIWQSMNKQPTPGLTLSDYWLNLSGPQTVGLHVDGVYHTLVDLGVSVDYTDTLAVVTNAAGFGTVACSEQKQLHTPLALVQFFSTFIPFAGPVLPSIIDHLTYGVDAPNLGVACQLVGPAFPQQVFIAGGSKLILDYQTVSVSPAGIVAGGNIDITQRRPVASVVGTDTVLIPSPNPGSMTYPYGVSTGDMRGPLTASWSGAHDTIQAPFSMSTNVTFGTGSRSLALTPSLSVTVTDADGLMASSSLAISYDITDPTVGKVLN
jgi:hypothetical protein